MFIDFTVRFVWFCVKVILSCGFVMILQLQVGEQSLEQMLENALKKSSISQYFRNLTKTGAQVVGHNVKEWVYGDRQIASDKTSSFQEAVYENPPAVSQEPPAKDFIAPK